MLSNSIRSRKDYVCACKGHLDDPQWIRNFLHQGYNSSTSFGKVVLHFTFEPMRYTGQAMEYYITRCAQMSTQMASVDAAIHEGVLDRSFGKGFEDHSRFSFRNSLTA